MTMKRSLLDQAKTFPMLKDPTPQEVALALAWVRGHVRLRQVDKALGRKSSGAGAYSFLARCLRQHIRELEAK
jgi:hypothetical protein